MFNETLFTLINPQNGDLAFKLFSMDDSRLFHDIQRLPYYSMIWVQKGNGTLTVDFSEHSFAENTLFAFTPYQPFRLNPVGELAGIVLNFHPDFFCIHKHQEEVACNGVLFNNIYQPPFVAVEEKAARSLETLIAQMKAEMENPALAHYEVLVSYLKIFLITASRLKSQQLPTGSETLADAKEPFILQNLKNYIDLHFKTKHSPSEYANLLHITPKALAKITKGHFNKTLTDLISERIIIEAKRELYLTNKPIKAIAFELGYEDEHYFSRFFKNNATVSPQVYRDTVGFAKAMA